MGTNNLSITVKPRTPGKHFSRTSRKEGEIPAVIYGPKTKTSSILLSEFEATKYSRRGFENTIFTLQSDSKELNGIKVLRKAIAIHPLSRRPIHMDFFVPDMTKAVRVNVELRFVGKALGVAEGGILSAARRNVEIECLPTEIPEFFEVDVTNIGLNQSMHVSDMTFPEGVKLITAAHETIATVSVVEEVVAAAQTAAAPAEGAAAPADGAAAPAAGAAAPAAGAAPAADAKKKDDKK